MVITGECGWTVYRCAFILYFSWNYLVCMKNSEFLSK